MYSYNANINAYSYSYDLNDFHFQSGKSVGSKFCSACLCVLKCAPVDDIVMSSSCEFTGPIKASRQFYGVIMKSIC
jgi:hypothetical protein